MPLTHELVAGSGVAIPAEAISRLFHAMAPLSDLVDHYLQVSAADVCWRMLTYADVC